MKSGTVLTLYVQNACKYIYTYIYTIIGNVCNKLNALEGSNQMKCISRSCHVHQVLYIYTVNSVAHLFEVPCMLQEGSHVPLHLQLVSLLCSFHQLAGRDA